MSTFLSILFIFQAMVSIAVTLPSGPCSGTPNPVTGLELTDGPGFNLPLSYNKMAYTTKMSIGSPPQDFTFVVGSSYQEFWVRSANCTEFCGADPKYDSSLSSTYQADGRAVHTWSYENVVGTMDGYLSTDTVSIGVGKIESILFGEIQNVFGSLYEQAPDIAGSLGLGFRSNSPFEFFVDDLLRFTCIHKVAGFYLKRIKPAVDKPYHEHGGYVTLGAKDGDRSLYDGAIHWVKTNKATDGDQLIPIGGISAGDNISLCTTGGGCSAVVDTQRMLIGFPGEDSFKINQGLGFIPWIGSGFMTDCNRMAELPNVTITIDGYKVVLPPSEYLIDMDGGADGFDADGSDEERACLSAFYGVEGTKIVLGLPFLYNAYTLFDYDRKMVGLAQFKPSAAAIFAD